MAINMHQQVYVVFLVLIGIMYDIPYLIFFFRVWRCLQNKLFSLNQPKTTNEIAQDTVDGKNPAPDMYETLQTMAFLHVFTISTGAGFLPSTVVRLLQAFSARDLPVRCHDCRLHLDDPASRGDLNM